jgi:hypothetical protein
MADEWKGLSLVFCPLIVRSSFYFLHSFIFSPDSVDLGRVVPFAAADHAKSVENWEKKERARKGAVN